METSFKTLAQIKKHLENVKKRIDKIKAKNPDLSFSTYQIDNIPLDLMYQIDDYIGKNEPHRQSFSKMEFKNNRLSIWHFYGKSFAIGCWFQSVECLEDDECLRKRKFKEVIKIDAREENKLLERA